MRIRQHASLAAGLSGLLGGWLLGCGTNSGATVQETESLETTQGALQGTEVAAMVSHASPDSAVLQVCQSGNGPSGPDTCAQPGGGFTKRCTAVLIGRNIALMAAHCLCVQDTGAPFRFSGLDVPLTFLKDRFQHQGVFCGFPSSLQFATHDLAVVTLKTLTNLTESEYPKPYTNQDFLERFQGGSITPPVQIFGWGFIGGADAQNPANYKPRKAFIEPSRLSFSGNVIAVSSSPLSNPSSGDGGGPIFMLDGEQKRIVGLQSVILPESLDSGYAPTWDTLAPNPTAPPDEWTNGEFIRQTLAKIDKDGDGISDDLDNCSPDKHCPGNPLACANFSQQDLNNNGIGDVCDQACKGNDCDGDGLGAACDPDNDNDGVLDKNDNCLCNSNTDQSDADGDGKGDACDTCDNTLPDDDGDGIPDQCSADICPCSPPSEESTDSDNVCNACHPELSDFCAQYCPKAKLDNCPQVNNDDQLNCNEESENARSAKLMGDACDPVPCPRFANTTGDKETLSQSSTPILIPNQDIVATKTITTSAVATNNLLVTPLGSRSTGGLQATLPKGAEASVKVDKTAYRYCLERVSVDCRDSYVNDDYILNQKATRDLEDKTSIWFRITLSNLGAEEYDPGRVYVIGNSWSKIWNWKADFTYWTQPSKWGTEFFTGIPSEDGQGAGRLWVWGDSKVGTTNLSKGTGLHPKANSPTTPSEKLVNHYENFQGIETIEETSYSGFFQLPQYKPNIKWIECNSCPSEVEPPVQGGDPWDGLISAAHGWLEGQSQILVSMADLPSENGILLSNSKVANISSKMGQHFSQSLTDQNVQWVSQAEPTAHTGRGTRMPSGVALNKEGTSHVNNAFILGGRIYATRDLSRRGEDVPRTTSSAEAPATMGSALLVAAPGPTPRKNFIPVYSRSEGLLFVVGGQDSSTNEPVGEVWLKGVVSNVWSRVSTEHYAPRRVLAATYAAGERKLWILDEDNKTPPETARLVRLSVDTGAVEVVGSWPRFKQFDRHWLVVDHHDQMLLVASSNKTNKHVVLRFEVHQGQIQVAGMRRAKHPLMFEPVVDATGYWFALEKGPKPELAVERLVSLGDNPASWAHIGECF